MDPDLARIRVTVVGGDAREIILMRELVRLGAEVTAVGFCQARDIISGVQSVQDIREALQGAQAVWLTMPGLDDRGIIRAAYALQPLMLDEQQLAVLAAGTPVFVGVARPLLKGLAVRYGWKLVEVAEIDEVAILNSIPSAEGAIQIAMQELPITIHGNRAVVIGFGRVGQTLARMLSGIGAETWVVARSSAHLARAYEAGYKTCGFDELKNCLAGSQMIFNTVPAIVLTGDVLEIVSREALIVDLASSPGGTDFQTATNLGIKAILAPGLPGKVAPVTAGEILARVMPALIVQHVG